MHIPVLKPAIEIHDNRPYGQLNWIIFEPACVNFENFTNKPWHLYWFVFNSSIFLCKKSEHFEATLFSEKFKLDRFFLKKKILAKKTENSTTKNLKRAIIFFFSCFFMTLYNNSHMTLLCIACLNNDPKK